MDIIGEKKALRREIRQRKAAMSEEGREAASARILAALEELPAFRDAGICWLTVHFRTRSALRNC